MKVPGNGALVPTGGGDAIPLIREVMTMGRRESCDIKMPFPNVSGMHCELAFRDGYWILRDLGSTNGVKVNGNRVLKKVLQPGDTITIAKRKYTIEYTPVRGSQSLDEIMEEHEDIDQPLLEKAGLVRPSRPSTLKRPERNKKSKANEEEPEDEE